VCGQLRASAYVVHVKSSIYSHVYYLSLTALLRIISLKSKRFGFCFYYAVCINVVAIFKLMWVTKFFPLQPLNGLMLTAVLAEHHDMHAACVGKNSFTQIL